MKNDKFDILQNALKSEDLKDLQALDELNYDNNGEIILSSALFGIAVLNVIYPANEDIPGTYYYSEEVEKQKDNKPGRAPLPCEVTYCVCVGVKDPSSNRWLFADKKYIKKVCTTFPSDADIAVYDSDADVVYGVIHTAVFITNTKLSF